MLTIQALNEAHNKRNKICDALQIFMDFFSTEKPTGNEEEDVKTVDKAMDVWREFTKEHDAFDKCGQCPLDLMAKMADMLDEELQVALIEVMKAIKGHEKPDHTPFVPGSTRSLN